MNRTPSVGFISWTIARGGSELHTESLADLLIQRGHRVVIIQVGHDYHAVRRHDASLEFVDVPALPRSPWAWRRLFASLRLDTVVLVKGAFNLRWTGLDLAMWHGGRRYLAIEHACPEDAAPRSSSRHLRGLVPGLGLWHYRSRLLRWLHRAALDHSIAVAPAICHQMVTQYGYRADQVTIVSNGVDSHQFHFDAAARCAARRRWQIPDGTFVFGSLSRLTPVKRIDRLLTAFAEVARQATAPVRLVMVGSGESAAELRQLSGELGVADMVIWAGESATPEREYPGFDAFVLASEVEGLPRGVLEAMACERVPVVMEVSSVGDLVEDGVTGRIVAQDTEAFADAMVEVMASPEAAREAMGARARDRVVSRYDAARAIAAAAGIVAPEIVPARMGAMRR